MSKKRYRYSSLESEASQKPRLFVYGIFLGESNRKHYNMTDPHYATVLDYITIGDHIVKAVPVPPEVGASLTGLIVTPDESVWEKLDGLEGGYDRILVPTDKTHGEKLYMYVEHQTELENHSTYKPYRSNISLNYSTNNKGGSQ